MKLKDLLTVCIQNLSRHKARTMLTVLGVIVGCCSVVIMISIGIGMKEAQDKALAQMGDLTIITVYPSGRGTHSAKLDDKTMAKIKSIKYVIGATPKLTAENLPLTLYAGRDRRYRAVYASIVGMDLKQAEIMGYQLTEGSWEQAKTKRVFVGQSLAYAFEDTKRPEGRNMVENYSDEYDETGMPILPKPYFDAMRVPLTIEAESGKEDGKKLTQALQVAGKLKEDYGKGEETSIGIVMDLADLKSLIQEQERLSGKKSRAKGYPSALVKVDDIKNIESIEGEIRRMGFRTSSMESIRKPMEQQARQKQMMLGGLGAISLFVAALGITNTMIMSISERTREIGVMKSLGCFVRDIRRIFLLEAGCIGLLGGITGSLVSYLISALMNLASGGGAAMFSSMDEMGMEAAGGGRLSVIPWWLTLFAIVFSVLIGVGSGYYPANQAVKIPALEAIKHD